MQPQLPLDELLELVADGRDQRRVGTEVRVRAASLGIARRRRGLHRAPPPDRRAATARRAGRPVPVPWTLPSNQPFIDMI
jgi:hypothetical protein